MTEERLTPFMLFYCEVRDKVEKESPKLQPHEVSSEIARRWKALPADQSRAYSVLSATYAEQKKFQKDTPKVPPSPKPVKKRKERYKDPRAPKSATSAYMYFSKHHRTLLKRENASLTFGDLGKTVGAMWKAATPSEKKPFEDLAARDRCLVSQQFGGLRRFHFLDMSRLRERRRWVVSFPILRPFLTETVPSAQANCLLEVKPVSLKICDFGPWLSVLDLVAAMASS